jgi:hypothetical protein
VNAAHEEQPNGLVFAIRLFEKVLVYIVLGKHLITVRIVHEVLVLITKTCL